jgi:holo-[acyl-carrier protein] synthase
MQADEAPGRAGTKRSEVRGDAPASHRSEDAPRPHAPEGTTELGIDIIKVDRIRASLARFGERFSMRVLTINEQRYVRGRPETFAGRWAAKEAVSKVLGLGVRGIGWRDIEIERLPTGQPAVRLHGRAAGRAEQLGMDRIAVSITHESDYAVAIAFGIRTAGGRYVFPLDIEDRLDDRERRLLARMERLRVLHEQAARQAEDDGVVARVPAAGSGDEDQRGRRG